MEARPRQNASRVLLPKQVVTPSITPIIVAVPKIRA